MYEMTDHGYSKPVVQKFAAPATPMPQRQGPGQAARNRQSVLQIIGCTLSRDQRAGIRSCTRPNDLCACTC